MRPLHQAALVTTGVQDTRQMRLYQALAKDGGWRYETECAKNEMVTEDAKKVQRALLAMGRLTFKPGER